MARTLYTRLNAALQSVVAAHGGYQQQSTGAIVGVRQMPDPHLVNALLAALRDQRPRAVTRCLAVEVVRRQIQPLAYAMARERDAAATLGRLTRKERGDGD